MYNFNFLCQIVLVLLLSRDTSLIVGDVVLCSPSPAPQLMWSVGAACGSHSPSETCRISKMCREAQKSHVIDLLDFNNCGKKLRCSYDYVVINGAYPDYFFPPDCKSLAVRNT